MRKGGPIGLAVAVALPLLGQAAFAATAPGPAARPRQVAVLTAALGLMRADYAELRSQDPGPEDVFDYQVGPLWRRGIDGAGTTIALIEGWDDPAIAAQVHVFDQRLGLPDPRITTIYPTGDHALPAKCPPGMAALGDYGSCAGWAGELELDVLSAHLMAPYASILIAVAPADSEITDDAASQVAPPEMMQAVEYIAGRRLANVISISTSTGEETYSHGRAEITAQDAGELTAAAAGIPVLVVTGDCDAAQHLPVAGAPCVPGATTTGRATAAWDDSPWVTAVGGSVPDLTASGRRAGSDPVWNAEPSGIAFGSGAGLSAVFGRPGYQDQVRAITRSGMRSVPDLTMDARRGTSEAAPLLAGVLALATQANHGRDIGPLNNVLYHVLGPHGLADGIADVVNGDDSVYRGGALVLRGFTAAKGFDVVSGWGTVRASRFVPALAAATAAAHQDRAVRRRAAAALAVLRHRVKISPGDIPAGGSAVLSAGGFLPLHPVTLSLGGRIIAVARAGPAGRVSYAISPAALGLAAGRHTLRLTSMLLTVRTTFRSRA